MDPPRQVLAPPIFIHTPGKKLRERFIINYFAWEGLVAFYLSMHGKIRHCPQRTITVNKMLTRQVKKKSLI